MHNLAAISVINATFEFWAKAWFTRTLNFK